MASRIDPAIAAIQAQIDTIVSSRMSLKQQYILLRSMYVEQDRMWLERLGELERRITEAAAEEDDARRLVRAGQEAQR